MWIVHDGREEIDGLHQRESFAEQIDSGVVVGVESDEHVGIGLPRQFAQDRVERGGIQFCRAACGLGHRRQFHLSSPRTPLALRVADSGIVFHPKDAVPSSAGRDIAD